MLRIIDEINNIDMTAKFELGQRVYMTGYQGYRSGVITGVSVNSNDKGTIFIYNVKQYVSKNSTPKMKKCLEKHLFSNVKDALEALAEMADKREKEQETSGKEDSHDTLQEL